MRYLDITKLIGGEHMTTFCTLAKNGLSFPTKALIDSGANSFVFIDTTFLKYLSPFFKPILRSLKTPIQVRGYNGNQGPRITYYTLLNLTVDGRIQSFTPFLITHLGTQSVILGRHWLAENRILVDCARKKLYWPKDIPQTITYMRNIPIQLRGDQMVNRHHQADADYRDRQLDDYWRKRQQPILSLLYSDNSNSLPMRSLYKANSPSVDYLNSPLVTVLDNSNSLPVALTKAVRTIEKELKKSDSTNLSTNPRQPVIKRIPKPLWQLQVERKPAAVEIHSISSTALNLICKKHSDYELFSVTLQEINTLIDEQRTQADQRTQMDDLVTRIFRNREALEYARKSIEKAQVHMTKSANKHRRPYNEPPPPINITGMDEYIVEQILACKLLHKSLMYRVQWQNYDVDLTWYSASDLKISPLLLCDFHIANPTLPGPPALLPEWLRLYQEGEDDYDYLEDNHPMTPIQKKRFLSSLT
ncbi:retrovirus protein [Rutstroemia sp. NJR-2017a WRK4]|nr:retrovirus protein [Rutstroemia sp. NJR-2017a WRK4]